MTKDNVTEMPAHAPEASVIPFGQTTVRTPEKQAAEKPKAPYKEPQIKALLRIFGEVVYDIFPQTFIDAVESGYKFWVDHPDSYLDTLFDSEQERNDSLTAMRAYSEIAGPDAVGYTIATRAHENPAMLVWRAQTRRKHNTDN